MNAFSPRQRAGRLVRTLSLVVALSGCEESDDPGASGGAGAGGAGSGSGDSSAGSAGTGATGGASAAVPGSVVDAQGRLNCDAYRALARDYPAFIDYLNGPSYAAFHQDGGPAATIHDRANRGRYCFGDGEANAVDGTGFSGQVLHLEDGPGVSRTRLIWSKHTGHGGTEFAVARRPRCPSPSVAGVSPGPITACSPFTEASSARLEAAIAAICFHSRSSLRTVPTDVAVTNNSEFAFVTVWDTAACKGRVAVFAPTQRDGFLPGLPNAGFFGALKLIGHVELPFGAPTRISASVDFAQWMSSPSKDAQAALATQSGRDDWNAGADETRSAAKAGFALVASRDENKVAVLELQPLLAYYRSMYFGTQDKYEQTRNAASAPNQWPFSFATAPAAQPKVHQVLDIPKPSVVITGFPIGDRSYTDAQFAAKAYVATVDGELRAYNPGGLATDAAGSALQPLQTRALCKNPTRVDYGRGGKSRDGLVFACRGDRTILFVDGGGTSLRTLADSRLNDPVAVSLGDSRGASVVSVANFSSRKVLNYLTSPVDAWGAKIFGGLGADGAAEFEFTGSVELSGKPFDVSAAEVP